jgi:hypothetical protein
MVGGYKTLDPSNPTFVTVYSINATKLFTINYHADPSDYDNYLPGVQKIVERTIQRTIQKHKMIKRVISCQKWKRMLLNLLNHVFCFFQD